VVPSKKQRTRGISLPKKGSMRDKESSSDSKRIFSSSSLEERLKSAEEIRDKAQAEYVEMITKYRELEGKSQEKAKQQNKEMEESARRNAELEEEDSEKSMEWIDKYENEVRKCQESEKREMRQ
ncbi:hypothetical protein PENTCL1PPCAC_7305, partial [Pristionchus entomophagus]